VAEGVTVVREGDPGDSLYLIADGKFTVEKTGTRLAMLLPGDLFGEIALMYDLPRTATVRSVLPGRVYTLGRREFMTAMGATGEANIAARRLAEQRLDEQRRMDRPTPRD
jgi:CRP-like cAMP-binding protein